MSSGYRRSFTDENGKRHFVRGSSPDDVAEKIVRLKEKLRRQLVVIDNGMTVAEWIESYLEVFIQPSVNEKWACEIARMLRQRVASEIGELKVRSVREIHLQKIIVGAKDMSYSYRYKLVIEIKRLFRLARRNKLSEDDPAEGLRLPSKRDEQIGRALTDEERAMLEPFLPKHRFGLEAALMLYAGLRSQEVIALDKSDVDLPGRRIHVRRAFKSDGTIGVPKSAAGSRTVFIVDKLATFLDGRCDGDGPLCVQTKGQRHSKASFREGWHNLLRELNISLGCKVFRLELLEPYPFPMDLKPYYLRHTFCTDCERAGIPVQITARAMGHSSTSVTLRYYTHPNKESIDAALDAMNDLHSK